MVIPRWIRESSLLDQAFVLARTAHGDQRRASDGRLFLEHVTEVAALLNAGGFDLELVAAGLLHDSVERGSLTESTLRSEMEGDIPWLVMTLSEDSKIDDFGDRKAALREQVRSAGGRAITIFAADKLSDIVGLRRGISTFGDGVEARIGTSVTTMAGHYRRSVEMISVERPSSAFLPRLRLQLQRLAADAGRMRHPTRA